ncbi:MAG: helix-hairpin-helix domain-containing protein [Bacteroidetes bacterium]|nr:helix-hairpin-helix domain-containing protein [Bacteroidota bacterium]
MSSIIKDYFTFSRREQRGILVLVVITAGIITYNLLIPVFAPVKDFDISGFEQDVARFILVQDSLDSLKSIKFQSKRVYPEKQGNKTYEKVCIEINAADSAGLTKIRGIGGVFAKRIIRYREMLGGFYNKRQLMEVYGIDSTNFPGIAEQIRLDTSMIRKININTVVFKELLKHPYLDYEDVKAIFRLKDRLGGHISRVDLLNTSKPDKDIINKIMPYLNFETQ